jgi:hypothetical protein
LPQFFEVLDKLSIELRRIICEANILRPRGVRDSRVFGLAEVDANET